MRIHLTFTSTYSVASTGEWFRNVSCNNSWSTPCELARYVSHQGSVVYVFCLLTVLLDRHLLKGHHSSTLVLEITLASSIVLSICLASVAYASRSEKNSEKIGNLYYSITWLQLLNCVILLILCEMEKFNSNCSYETM